MTDWTQNGWVPKLGLQAWHAADAASSGQIIPDLSGNGRTLDAGSSNPPSLQTNILNGYPAVYFNGSTHEPLKHVGSLNVKHVFIVGSYELAAFATFAGLIGGISTVDILVGFSGLTQWFDFSSTYGSYDYRLADVHYSESAALAPMSGGHSVMEYANANGLVMSGLQIGQQKTFTDRRWRGWYFESLVYDRILSANERRQIYEYFSAKYHLWTKTDTGLYVFPFQPDWPQRTTIDRSVLISITAGGQRIARSKSSPAMALTADFSARLTAEAEAAIAFWSTHYPQSPFIYRDFTVNPPKELKVQFAGGIRYDASSYNDASYSIDLTEWTNS
jgi:hypothetical protein